MHASKYALRGTFIQIDDQNHEPVIEYFLNVFQKQKNHTSIDKELYGLVYCTKHFRCYLEESRFEVINDKQIFKNCMTKPQMSLKEARWLDIFRHFEIEKNITSISRNTCITRWSIKSITYCLTTYGFELKNTICRTVQWFRAKLSYRHSFRTYCPSFSEQASRIRDRKSQRSTSVTILQMRKREIILW